MILKNFEISPYYPPEIEVTGNGGGSLRVFRVNFTKLSIHQGTFPAIASGEEEGTKEVARTIETR